MATSLLICLLALWFGGFASASRGTFQQRRYASAQQADHVGQHQQAQATPTHASGVTALSFESRRDLDKEVIDAAHARGLDAHAGTVGSKSASPKVAFIFLTYEGISTLDVWEAYFKDAPRNQFSIYIHEASLVDKKNQSHPALPLAQFGAVQIPTTKSAWCAILGLEVHALTTALNHDAANTQFLILAGSSLPIKSFSYLHDQLIVKSPETSKVCLATAMQGKTPEEEQAAHPNTPTCAFSDFLRTYDPRTVKIHNWMVVSREHATAIVKSALLGLATFVEVHQKSPPEVRSHAGCSDEYGPVTILLADYKQAGKSTGDTWADLKKMGVELRCTTLAVWQNCAQGTSVASDWKPVQSEGWLGQLIQLALSFEGNENAGSYDFPHQFDKVSYEYLEHVVKKESFFFARKFTVSSKVEMSDGTLKELHEVLPALWAEPGDPSRDVAIWPSLDVVGEPKIQAK